LPVVGVLRVNTADTVEPMASKLRAALAALGQIDGRTIRIETRLAEGHVERLPELARSLVAEKASVIITAGDPPTRAAQQATQTIPIVALVDDLVAAGLINSLAKPGGNTTGVSILATELDGKRQEILMEAVPGLRRMAALADSNTTAARQLQALQEAARARGVELSIHRVSKSEEVVPAIDAAKTSEAAALNVLASPLLFANRQGIFERAAALRLRAVYQWPEMAEQGGLVAYGPRIVQIFREVVARQLVKLLRGAKPADLPVEQPTNFELVINLKTAKAIGHEVPAGFVLRADKVIE